MKKYVIIREDEVKNVDFSQVMEDSWLTLRYSNDGLYTFVKYEGEQPSFLAGKTEYTNAEMLVILATEDWTAEFE
jgi:hypothetical protein|tara:strand:- start:2234 stop:2458 length:225 start_codon:yes stop_codon:yes gene_type:complete